MIQAFHIPARYNHHHLEHLFLCNAVVSAFAFFQYHIMNRKTKAETAKASKEEKTKENVEYKQNIRQSPDNSAIIWLQLSCPSNQNIARNTIHST